MRLELCHGWAVGRLRADGDGEGTTATDSNPSPSTTTLAEGGERFDTGLRVLQSRADDRGSTCGNDANANGIQDGNETGIAGVTVTLTGTERRGQQYHRHHHNGFGGAVFVQRTARHLHGDGERPPVGYTPTLTGQGTAATDSNVNPSGTTPATLASGGSDLTVDFGFYQAVTIGDYVWNDANGNGVQDDGGDAAGLANVGLTLAGRPTAGRPVTDYTTTVTGGNVPFTEPPGTYTVSVDATNFAAGGPRRGMCRRRRARGPRRRTATRVRARRPRGRAAAAI